jgi:negative regulator of sigma-B (phosphoserine phosphatase)
VDDHPARQTALMSSGEDASLRWAIAGRPRHDQQVSGDLATVQLAGGRWVLAAVDGLGHGPAAADAAARFVEVVERNLTEPPDRLLHLADEALTGRRGAAATVVVIDRQTGLLNWLGVGNVEAVVCRADPMTRPRMHGVFLVSGVLGQQIRRPMHRPEPIQLRDRDVLVMASDGIAANLVEAVRFDLRVERLAARVLSDHSRPEDDAVVVAARYRVAA